MHPSDLRPAPLKHTNHANPDITLRSVQGAGDGEAAHPHRLPDRALLLLLYAHGTLLTLLTPLST